MPNWWFQIVFNDPFHFSPPMSELALYFARHGRCVDPILLSHLLLFPVRPSISAVTSKAPLPDANSPQERESV